MYCARIVILVILSFALTDPTSTSPTRLKRESVVCLPQHKKHFGVDRVLYNHDKCNLFVNGLRQAEVLESGFQAYGLVDGINKQHAQCYVEHTFHMDDRQCYKIVHEERTSVPVYPTNPGLISEGNVPVINVNSLHPQIVGPAHAANVVTDTSFINYPLIPMVEQNAYCDSNQQNCVSGNQVTYVTDGNYQCYSLLEPCDRDGWLTVNKTKFEYFGELEIICELPVCAPGYIIFEETGCVDQLYVQSVLCVGEILFDVFGVAHCGGGFTQEQMLSINFNPANGLCNFIAPQDVVNRVAFAGENVIRTHCGEDNFGNCRIEVEPEPDIPF